MTPEQQARAEAEANGHPRYDDGRPKYHRHFASFHIHPDELCTEPGRQIRVYVFDTEDLEKHEQFLTERLMTRS